MRTHSFSPSLPEKSTSTTWFIKEARLRYRTTATTPTIALPPSGTRRPCLCDNNCSSGNECSPNNRGTYFQRTNPHTTGRHRSHPGRILHPDRNSQCRQNRNEACCWQHSMRESDCCAPAGCRPQTGRIMHFTGQSRLFQERGTPPRGRDERGVPGCGGRYAGVILLHYNTLYGAQKSKHDIISCRWGFWVLVVEPAAIFCDSHA